MKDFLDQILKILQERIGWRPIVEFLLALLGASVTLFLISRNNTHQEVLAVGIWLLVASWYFWLVYRKRLGQLFAIALLIAAISGSTVWIWGLVQYLGAAKREVARLGNLAEQYESKGLFAEAVGSQSQALSVARKSGDHNAELEMLYRLGYYQSEASQQEAADATWRSCLSLAVELKNRRMEGFGRSGLARSALDRRHFDLARQYYSDAGAIFESLEDTRGEAEVQLGLGLVEQRQGNPPLARQHFAIARDLNRQRKDLVGEATVLVLLSESERFTGETDAARRDIVDAGELFRKNGDLIGQANALYTLAELESRLDNTVPALQAYGKARGLYQQGSSPLGEANVLRGMGDIEVSRKNIGVAREHYVEAQLIFERVRDAAGEGAANLGLGRVEIIQEHYSEAHDYLSRARAFFQQVDDIQDQANVDFWDGTALLGLNERAVAFTTFGRAASAFSAVGMKTEAERAALMQEQISQMQSRQQ